MGLLELMGPGALGVGGCPVRWWIAQAVPTHGGVGATGAGLCPVRYSSDYFWKQHCHAVAEARERGRCELGGLRRNLKTHGANRERPGFSKVPWSR